MPLQLRLTPRTCISAEWLLWHKIWLRNVRRWTGERNDLWICIDAVGRGSHVLLFYLNDKWQTSALVSFLAGCAMPSICTGYRGSNLNICTCIRPVSNLRWCVGGKVSVSFFPGKVLPNHGHWSGGRCDCQPRVTELACAIWVLYTFYTLVWILFKSMWTLSLYMELFWASFKTFETKANPFKSKWPPGMLNYKLNEMAGIIFYS